MTVAELISKLQDQPRDAIVIVGRGTGPVQGVRTTDAAFANPAYVVIEP
jgi:hypothetical protein